MDPAFTLRGFVLGFTIAAAVGPISLLVIRRTAGRGPALRPRVRAGCRDGRRDVRRDRRVRAGAITDALVNARQVLGLVGGVFLLWLAWQTIRSTPTEAGDGHERAARICRARTSRSSA